MPTGKIKFFSLEKGFGFIKPDDGSEDLFVHRSKLTDEVAAALKGDDQVSYEIGERASKKFAEAVSVIATAPVQRGPMRAKTRPLDEDEEFEREWGLRRAP